MEVLEVKKFIRGPLAPVLTVYKEGDLSLDVDAIQENVDQQIRRGMVKGNGVLLAAGAGGDPGLPQAALLGANGSVTHLANVWPEHEVELWQAFEARDYEQATEDFVKVNWPWRNLRAWAHREIGGGESLLVKPAAELAGFHGSPSRLPMVTLDAEQRAHVRSVLVRIGAPLA